MCGIIGAINAGCSHSEFRDLFAGIASRGKDAQNFFAINHNKLESGPIEQLNGSKISPILLGHSRFSLVDVENDDANQPFTDDNGKQILLFNGEIYNHLELRPLLENRYGVKFKTKCDTEVLFYGLVHEGAEFIDRLDGFWAFSFIDLSKNVVSFSRDRFGKKPLYFRLTDCGLLFSSSFQSIIATLTEKKLNHTSLYKYLFFDVCSDPVESYIEGVTQIKPGTLVEYDISINSFSEERNINFPSNNGMDFEKALKYSVNKRLSDEVKVSLNLSGGLDSVALAAAISELGKTDVVCHTIRFDGLDDFDVVNAKKVSEEFVLSHEIIDISSQDLWKDANEGLSSYHCPVHSPTVFAQKEAWRAISEDGFKVIIHGSGNDEFSFGYQYYLQIYQLMLARKKNIVGFFRYNDKSFINSIMRYIKWVLLKKNAQSHSLMHNKNKFLRNDIDPKMAVEINRIGEGIVASNSSLFEKREFDIETGRIPYWNMLMDESSMAIPVEIRMPYYDNWIQYIYANKPLEFFFNKGYSKNFLREYIKQHSKLDLLNDKKKKGFQSPDHKIVTENFQVISELINSGPLKRMIRIETHAKLNYNEAKFLWRAYCASKWLMDNGVTL